MTVYKTQKDDLLPILPLNDSPEEQERFNKDILSVLEGVFRNTKTDIDTVDTNIEDLKDARSPVGTILAWHKAFANTPSLTDNWVECNGQVLSDADSVYDGQTIPDLNGDERFLRGNAISGTENAYDYGDLYAKIRINASNNVTHVVHVSDSDTTDGNACNGGSGAGNAADTNWTEVSGDSEPVPINFTVVWIMRVK